jgi:hypothetical protein
MAREAASPACPAKAKSHGGVPACDGLVPWLTTLQKATKNQVLAEGLKAPRTTISAHSETPLSDRLFTSIVASLPAL